ncbi:thiopurine S-methyltransferase [Thalassotalea sp. ND16A]|uniref:thiopurine S-methyltransferase n=1 Tax=Thalassotalea sp. ND16A TaxID=1535422 RepID=UPI00051DD873|nr:thiopurine S-methyltransferase [Thalassotalea sp. ND16A]KGJ95764.1 Thiopurine S-methyltransferase [Thalassotalea sp. ND16A]
MKQQFWLDCWKNTRLGFHQDELQPLMVEHFPNLVKASDNRIFVPLCGKTADMLFFAERFKVIGNELSGIACHDFFADNKLVAKVKKSNGFSIFAQGNIELHQGDFFALDGKQFQPFDWIYDRAAIIAFPEDMRNEYVQQLKNFMTAATRIFLLTLEFPEDEMQGPPFSVKEDEVRQLFKGYKVIKQAERDLTGQKFARLTLPLSSIQETLYIISSE